MKTQKSRRFNVFSGDGSQLIRIYWLKFPAELGGDPLGEWSFLSSSNFPQSSSPYGYENIML